MAEPSYEELLKRIKDLEEVVLPYYEQPAGYEYSFPTEQQGITQTDFRLMNLGQANGMIHGDNGVINDSPNSTGWRYYLDTHESDAVTNERNTLILRAGTSAESIVEGFYHRLTQDLELEFPPVSSTTIYHVCITYDPRKFKYLEGPLKIEVYAGEPPTSDGRIHLLLHTVERRPNQLLTQTVRTRYRPYTAGLLSVQNRNQLPDPKDYPAGTVVVPSANGHGLYVRQNGGHKWLNPLSHIENEVEEKAEKPGPWKNIPLHNNGSVLSGQTPRYRLISGGVQLRGRVRAANRSNPWGRIPSEARVSIQMLMAVGVTSSYSASILSLGSDGNLSLRSNSTGPENIYLDGIYYPL